MDIIPRERYLKQIESSLGKGLILVLTGQRRVGKSYMLKLLCKRKSKDSANNIIYIDKEKREFDHIRNHEDLNAYIALNFDGTRHNYIMIDEVQDIRDFERSVRSFRTEEHTDIIITGSNSRILSSELSTLIGGRYKEIYIQPLSYNEFLSFHHLSDGDDALALYLQFGGLPGLSRIGLDEEEAASYLRDIYNTALLKDVIARNSIRNVPFLESLVLFLADNIGKQISANSISRYMKSLGEKVTPTAIQGYISYLTEAFILHRVNRYDIHGKRLFDSNDKFYFEDNGIRNALVGGSREGDIEKVIENVVYQHLVRLGYRVTVGQLQNSEIDFVAEKPGKGRIYVQATYIIADEATRRREFGNLEAIPDNYPKYVVSMTPLVSRTDKGGITHLHLRRFLSIETL